MNFSVVGSCGCAVTLVIFDMFKLRFESRGVLSICFQKSKSSPAFQQQKLKHVNPNGSRVSAKKNILKLLCVHLKSTVCVCLSYGFIWW